MHMHGMNVICRLKNSARLGKSIMINRDSPLPKIAGQMLLVVDEYKRFNPILAPHQCMKMILQNWQGDYVYIHKQREIMAGDEVGGNNVMECDANNNLGTLFTNNKSLMITRMYVEIMLGNNE